MPGSRQLPMQILLAKCQVSFQEQLNRTSVPKLWTYNLIFLD